MITMGGPRKKGKAGKKRYRDKAAAITLKIHDPQPKGRYNLGFYYEYPGQQFRIHDSAYLKAYHDKFSDALTSEDVWRKTPKSRNSCKCHKIASVYSLTDLAIKITEFTDEKERKKEKGMAKKFGTIFLLAHGSEDGLLLPIADRLAFDQVLRFRDLLTGLRNLSVIHSRAPKGWDQKTWNELRTPFLRLRTELDKLYKRKSWFDSKTLIRLWCCRFGDDGLIGIVPGVKDPLKLFARTLVGPNGHVTVEAPKCPTSGHCPPYPSKDRKGRRTALNWKDFISIYEKEKAGRRYYDRFLRKRRRRKKWHPDVIAEVECGKDGKRLKSKSDLEEAKGSFVQAILQPPPSPTGEKRYKWIPWLTVNWVPGSGIYDMDPSWLHIVYFFEGDDEYITFKYGGTYKGKNGKTYRHSGFWRKVTI